MIFFILGNIIQLFAKICITCSTAVLLQFTQGEVYQILCVMDSSAQTLSNVITRIQRGISIARAAQQVHQQPLVGSNVTQSSTSAMPGNAQHQ